MLGSKPAQKDRHITLKVIGPENLIADFIDNTLKRRYPSESLDISKLQKNIGDPNFHLFVKIVVEKTSPKEQTDVKVREVL